MENKHYGYWNIKENVIREAKKYETRRQFRLNCCGAYQSAIRNGWIDEMDWFLIRHKVKPNFWGVKENVIQESKKYASRKEFNKGCNRAWRVAIQNGWIDEMDWLIPKEECYSGHNYVYAYIDEKNKVAYVGLTSDKERRHKEHTCGEYDGKKIKSAVKTYFSSINEKVPTPIYLEEGLSRSDAQIKEDEYRKKYESMGYTMLNKGKTGYGCGALGRTSKWSKESVVKESYKYKSHKEFRKQNSTAYYLGKVNGWLSETHLIDDIKHPITKIMSIDECIEFAKKCNNKEEFNKNRLARLSSKKNGSILEINKYFRKKKYFEKSKKFKTRHDFRINDFSSYSVASKNKWLDEMVWLSTEKKYIRKWTKESAFEIAKQYTTKKEFNEGHKHLYSLCKKNGWLKEMTWLKQFIPSLIHPKPSKEDIFNESKSFTLISEFKKISPKYFKISKENGWLTEMVWLMDDNEKLKNEIFDFSKKYSTRGEFRVANPRYYKKAHSNKWLDEMTWLRKTKWDRDTCFNEAKKYASRKEFLSMNASAYTIARNHGWLNEMEWLKTNLTNNNEYNVMKVTLTKEELTKEKIIEVSKKYSSRTEFYKGCHIAYEYARINNLLDDLFIRYKRQ